MFITGKSFADLPIVITFAVFGLCPSICGKAVLLRDRLKRFAAIPPV